MTWLKFIGLVVSGLVGLYRWLDRLRLLSEAQQKLLRELETRNRAIAKEVSSVRKRSDDNADMSTDIFNRDNDPK